MIIEGGAHMPELRIFLKFVQSAFITHILLVLKLLMNIKEKQIDAKNEKNAWHVAQELTLRMDD